MANLNKVFLMGNLTRNPELRYTPNGTPLCEFGIAINRQWKTPEGEQREEVCFVDVTMWGRRGEVISQYFSKGKPIFIEGRLKLDQWESAEGKRSKLTVVAENFEFIGGQPKGQGGAPAPQRGSPPEGGGNRPAQRPPRQAPPTENKAQEEPPAENVEPPEEGGYDVSDDEIPF